MFITNLSTSGEKMSDFQSIAEAIFVPITVALITAGSSVFVVMKSNKRQSARMQHEAETFRRENTEQHNENKNIIDESRTLLGHLSNQVGGIDRKVDKLDERLDGVNLWQSEHEKLHLRKDGNNEAKS